MILNVITPHPILPLFPLMIGWVAGITTALSFLGLLTGLAGIKIHRMLRIKRTWRIFGFAFFLIGAIIQSFILIFTFGEFAPTTALFLYFPFFVGVALLVFTTIFEIKKIVNSVYWNFVISYFMACLAVGVPFLLTYFYLSAWVYMI